MKLLHNFVSLGMVTLLAEAGACAQRSGVAPEAFVEVLAKGGGGGIALERLKPFLLAQDPSGLRFSLSNAQKDLGYYQTMAQDAGAYEAVASAVLATIEQGVARTAPGTWVPALVRVLGED
jgi:3-hydroxyisobutyrate dehydrogenase-like beta-hydroxyacid dehydrogenase